MITFETSTRINRPLEDVFAYVSDPRNFPRWNSAVQAVRKTSEGDADVAASYPMERALPTGRAVNELEVLTREWPREFAIRTTAGPTPFRYRYRFSAEHDETVVRLKAEVDLIGPAALLPQLARLAVKKGCRGQLRDSEAGPRSGSRLTARMTATAGEDNLSGKVLIDIANPLDFSQGRPPSFSSPTPTRSASRSSVTSPRPRS